MNKVIANLWKKAELLKAKDLRHSEIRPLLLILSGGNLGVVSASACHALHVLGLGDVFDTVVGMSTGGWVGGYYIAGEEQIQVGTSIYYEEFATRKYINMWKFPYVMNPAIIESVTTTGKKKLNVDAIKNSRAQLFVGVTDMKGDGHFLDVKKSSNPLSALHASSAIPIGYKKPVNVNGVEYLDGGIALSFPLQRVIDQFNPTDILVLPNCLEDCNSQAPLFERIVVKTFLQHLPKPIKGRILSRHFDFTEGVRYAEGNSNISILWPVFAGIGVLTRDPRKLREAAVLSARRTCEFFGRPDLKVELY